MHAEDDEQRSSDMPDHDGGSTNPDGSEEAERVRCPSRMKRQETESPLGGAAPPPSPSHGRNIGPAGTGSAPITDLRSAAPPQPWTTDVRSDMVERMWNSGGPSYRDPLLPTPAFEPIDAGRMQVPGRRRHDDPTRSLPATRSDRSSISSATMAGGPALPTPSAPHDLVADHGPPTAGGRRGAIRLARRLAERRLNRVVAKDRSAVFVK